MSDEFCEVFLNSDAFPGLVSNSNVGLIFKIQARES